MTYKMIDAIYKELKETLEGLPSPFEDDGKVVERKFSFHEEEKKEGPVADKQQVKLEDIDVSYDAAPVEGHEAININDEKVKDRWSRYIGAMGIEAVAKQAESRILICGLGAIGVEIAKNIVLAGCKELILFDDIQPIIDEWENLGREEFLRVHSLNGAFKYLLAWGDGAYDAKAVAVQAIRVKHSEMAHLRSNAFEGDAKTIAEPLRTAGWDILDKRDLERVNEEQVHDKELQDRVNIGPAEKMQLSKSRIGQGKFKHNVLLRESKCRVTGIADLVHLRASHIKPWAKSNDMEKLDGNNGLLLAPHIDHLFDRGWITFSNEGDILYSKECSIDVFLAFGLGSEINVGQFSPEQCHYLDFHRLHVFNE